jgi:hypothetical protein
MGAYRERERERERERNSPPDVALLEAPRPLHRS